MKNILPIEDIIYKSSLSRSEVYDRLVSVIRTDKTYVGEWTNNTFNLKRNINYRNSFLPQIKGEICKETNETLIMVKMRLHFVVLIFISFWLIITSCACILAIYAIVKSGFEMFYLTPFGMFLFAYLLTLTSFKSESIRSKNDFQQIFAAEILK